MSKDRRSARRQRRRARPASGAAPIAPPTRQKPVSPPPWATGTSRPREVLLHALLQNGWIVVGVFALGWSASVTVGGIYLETLFCSLALRRAARRAGWASLVTGGSVTENGVTRREHLADRTKSTTLIGLAQGVFLLAFGVAVLRGPEDVDPIWRMSLRDLGSAALGALVTSVVEYLRLRRRLPGASEAWVRSRVDLQFSTTLALVLFMMVLPWTFFLVGERGLFVVLIGTKAALDAWLAGRRLSLT